MGIANTGNILEATASPVFDRWNSQEFIDNQAAVLSPYFLEAYTDSANYLTNVYIGTEYYEHVGATPLDEEESINMYCLERNPEYNRLMSHVVDQYQQLYVPIYDTYVALGYDKDTASIEATIETLRAIKLRVDANFDAQSYRDSITACVYQGQYDLAISQ